MDENKFPEDVMLYYRGRLYRWESPRDVNIFCDTHIAGPFDRRHESYQINISGCARLTIEQKEQLLLGSVEDWQKIVNEYTGMEKQE